MVQPYRCNVIECDTILIELAVCQLPKTNDFFLYFFLLSQVKLYACYLNRN